MDCRWRWLRRALDILESQPEEALDLARMLPQLNTVLHTCGSPEIGKFQGKLQPLLMLQPNWITQLMHHV